MIVTPLNLFGTGHKEKICPNGVTCFNDLQSYVNRGFVPQQVHPSSTGLSGRIQMKDTPWSCRLGIIG